MSEQLDALSASLSAAHSQALSWFDANEGREVGWAEILAGTGFPITTIKGIYKPGGAKHVLSIRQSLGSSYDDRPVEIGPDGGWRLDYFQEGFDPADVGANFTNRAMFACRDDGVPVGVIVQTRRKPRASYRIQGLARVVDFDGGHFRLESFRFAGVAAELPTTAQPTSLKDARRRIDAAIVARQGAGLFRTQALSIFGARCALSDCDVPEALEAAHIVPYLGEHTNAPANTLLLRADLHTLFDRQLLDIDPMDLRVRLAPALMTSTYAKFHERHLRLPLGVKVAELCANLKQRRAHLAGAADVTG